MNKIISLICTSILLITTLSSCQQVNKKSSTGLTFIPSDFTFDVKPETFELFVEKDGVKESASLPMEKERVTNLVKTRQSVSWSYPDEKMDINIQKKKNYLDVTLKSSGSKKFVWPKVSSSSYILPFGEGKMIPSNDENWKKFLSNDELSFAESFSMRFFTLNKSKYSITYIAKNMFNNTVKFNSNSSINFAFEHEFPTINPDKTYGFRIYVTDHDIVHIAKIYKDFVVEKGEFKTLADKSKENHNIEKLYGAPHIYLWNNEAISSENIKWNLFQKKLNSEFFQWTVKLMKEHYPEEADEYRNVLNNAKEQTYLDNYQKNNLIRALNSVVKLNQFYNKSIFHDLDDESNKLIKKGVSKLSEQELYTLNKHLLKVALSDSIDPINKWANYDSIDLVNDLNKSGIRKAWIGLPNWANGLINPEMVKQANKLGYLIGPYDSYHSIQKDASIDWNTASFEDKGLYDNATITNKNGEKIKGFLGRGRKLNPTLSLPSVKQRVGAVLQGGIDFNTWFIDCDATGEIYDDYTKAHPTTQKQDLAARLNRMNYIATKKNMVVGSEGGNDFASKTIAFAHGIETPVIQWSDSDMRTNKNSQYYVGGYWSSTKDIPERYSKQVPIKELYKEVYLNPAYTIPMYKLVYNNSVITTHHWEFGSLKIKDEIKNRMLYELLYNVPPLYHLDSKEWENNKKMITSYLKIWSSFHEKAVQMEMTNYKILKKDRTVQSTEFGKNLKVIVNFSNSNFKYKNETIPSKTAVIYEGNKKIVFN
ncbi:glycoside hydrolase [Gottfriedia acidiceleris]|uniref:glycoside hydrolase n=1 Tax=Gottfriedia acidiceleris TaxID=371036 RepID=UPI000B43BBC1|nr:glycoside hydrolase [Gottfriedia acidiceleris]